MSTVLEEPKAAAEALLSKPGALPEAPPEIPETQAAQTPGPQAAAQKAAAVEVAGVRKPLTRAEVLRPALGALSTTLGCAFLVGGMFTGFSPRVYAAIGGIVGVAAAAWAAQARKRVSLVQAISLAAILLAGLLLLVIGDFGALGNLGKVIGEATKNARLRKPPVFFDPGWKAILPWTVGMVGYAAAWVGAMGRKPALGLLVPIPIIAFSAIAQPAEAQVPAGIVAFVTFAIGLAVIYRADRGEGEGVSTAYELKRAMRAAPLVLALTAGLIALAQTNLLFPAPLYDPTQRAQLPRAIPLSGVPDRVLFTAQAPEGFTGPWRTGVLDVYDGENWRLPPYNASSFKKAPLSGLIDEAFGQPQQQQLRAQLSIGALEGTVLPLPSRVHGLIVERAPPLVTDKRTETVRVAQGQISSGLDYEVRFALLPSIRQLRTAGPPNADIAKLYLDTANRVPPPAVKELLDAAGRATRNSWDRLDSIRKALLDTVTAAGQGLPSSVPPAKVQDMLAGKQEGTPFEIVAAQVLLARWAGVPARLGFGFDRGERKSSILEFRPKHGAAWLEVYFQGSGWFPVTGLPKKAKAIIGSSDQQLDANILPSNEIAVQLFIPLRVTPKNLFFKQAQIILALASPFIVTGLLVWLLWPVAYKARRRSRRRQWALEQGRTARIAVAYAELRDAATDLGVGDPYLTPLAYIGKVVPDEEHRELAWLVTRTLWGDMRNSITDDEVFAAEELSRSLRRRLFEAQPFTIRGISVVSRLSLRNPYAPELLSPALERLDARTVARAAVKRLRPRLPHRRRRILEETPDEALEIA